MVHLRMPALVFKVKRKDRTSSPETRLPSFYRKSTQVQHDKMEVLNSVYSESVQDAYTEHMQVINHAANKCNCGLIKYETVVHLRFLRKVLVDPLMTFIHKAGLLNCVEHKAAKRGAPQKGRKLLL